MPCRPGGTLTIAVTCVDETPPTRHHGAVHGPHVAISIADTGSGIAPNVVDRVFEPFFTTKAPGHGTGLGLSQVFGFVSQSGGHVDVASTPGSGTVFTLYLAKAQPTGLEDLLSPQADISGITQRPRHKILLVDDNAEVSDIVKNLLQDLGQDVVLARHGNAALEILRQQDGAFDLVITDIVMPELNGIDLARHIQEQWPGLRIVLATGYTHTLAELGPADFHLLHKPYSIEALTKVIDAIPRA